MRHFIAIAAVVALVSVSFSASASTSKTYQVTGPVLEVSDSKIVVQKGSEKWEIARTPESKIPADVKVGSKVTVQYTMSATDVVSKDAADKKETKKQ